MISNDGGTGKETDFLFYEEEPFCNPEEASRNSTQHQQQCIEGVSEEKNKLFS